MKFKVNDPPRTYTAGISQSTTIADCGRIQAEPNEQLTFETPDGKEYDVARKEWGFYATPSVNGRLKRFGFKTALVKNTLGQYYVMLVEEDKMDLFTNYLKQDQQQVVEWLDERS